MLEVSLDLLTIDGVQSLAPGAGGADLFGGQTRRLLLHEQQKVILGGDVAVERHRRVAQPRGDRCHRHGGEPVGIRDLDGGLDDALDAHLALGATLRVRCDAPGEGDSTRKLGL